MPSLYDEILHSIKAVELLFFFLVLVPTEKDKGTEYNLPFCAGT